ncbi:glutathione synthetase [Pseudogymnoascus sp. 24MN13]|nr:glutathione synthetase [Pseudogymnoascus sp. 24MN13]
MVYKSYRREPTPEQIAHITTLVKDWSIAHGLAVRPPPALVASESDPHGILATTAPVTLLPSPFPQVCFKQASSVQTAYNGLYASISRDEGFLASIVEEILEVDEFIAELWKVHLQVKGEGYSQKLSLGLFRSDYMVHQDLERPNSTPHIKQVEFNTIASSFGGLSSQTSKLHRYLARTAYGDLVDDTLKDGRNLPENASTETLGSGLRTAFKAYGESAAKHQTCILFVVQDQERNIFDQRHLEYDIEMNSDNVRVFRLPFSRILADTTLESTTRRELLYRPPHSPSEVYEVAVVYFRSAYGPSDYPNKAAWEARLHIERSNAIKCPSILTQLAGAKKVQQVLATPVENPATSILSKFIPDSTTRTSLEETFTNIYPLDQTPAGLSARELALDEEKCKGYVLKPQREGGGNNIYRSAIPGFLRSLPESHWKSYILMEIITPPPVQNLILRNGEVEKGGVICELGVYGTCLWNQETGDVLSNEGGGYLLRTKGDQSEEGGVAAGFGAMDSVWLN